VYAVALMALAAPLSAAGQAPACAPRSDQRLIIYRAGSLTSAFKPLIDAFTCQTGIQVKDMPMGSVDAARQITAGGQACDLFAPADDSIIELFMKPAGYAAYTLTFARGKMVLIYSKRNLAGRKLPSLAEPGADPSILPAAVPKASARWYEILTSPGVRIGAGHPFLDPGAYRADMIFQLAEAYYHVPNLYNDLLGHVVIVGPDRSGTPLGDRFDAQFIYEHSARALAAANPDIGCVDLPDAINLSGPESDAYYRQHSVVVLPGLGTPQGARSVAVPGTRVAWGITVMKNAPNPGAAVTFLQLLLGPTGKALLNESGLMPVSPAVVSPADVSVLPESLRRLVALSRSLSAQTK
jgi:molybdate/tungstate transport system substrate-binding protein